MAPRRLEMAPRTLQILTNSVKKCQTVLKVSEDAGHVRKHNAFGECQNVSKSSRVSKRVKKYQKSVKKVSKTCQNVSKRVKK